MATGNGGPSKISLFVIAVSILGFVGMFVAIAIYQERHPMKRTAFQACGVVSDSYLKHGVGGPIPASSQMIIQFEVRARTCDFYASDPTDWHKAKKGDHRMVSGWYSSEVCVVEALGDGC